MMSFSPGQLFPAAGDLCLRCCWIQEGGEGGLLRGRAAGSSRLHRMGSLTMTRTQRAPRSLAAGIWVACACRMWARIVSNSFCRSVKLGREAMRASAEGVVLTMLGPIGHLVFCIRQRRESLALIQLIYVTAIITTGTTKCRGRSGDAEVIWRGPFPEFDIQYLTMTAVLSSYFFSRSAVHLSSRDVSLWK